MKDTWSRPSAQAHKSLPLFRPSPLSSPALPKTGLSVAAFSGGKDSSAMVLGLHERGEAPDVCLFTPTGNELPGVREHIEVIVDRIGSRLIVPDGGRTLLDWINEYEALPNWRQRWCTRLIKIVPCIAWLKQNHGSTLLVGLRADEEERSGLYGEYATYRYPLREWGWSVSDVWAYLGGQGVAVPRRTDCAWCYDQGLADWYDLWRLHPEMYQQAVDLEARIGHTFRGPTKSPNWPHRLEDIRAAFESGRKPRTARNDDEQEACRVCRL